MTQELSRAVSLSRGGMPPNISINLSEFAGELEKSLQRLAGKDSQLKSSLGQVSDAEKTFIHSKFPLAVSEAIGNLFKKRFEEADETELSKLPNSQKIARKLFSLVRFIAAQATNSANPVFSVDWHKRNQANWLKWLADFKGKPVRAIEIGSYEGASAQWQVDNILTHQDASLICIDPWEGAGGCDELSKYALSYIDMNSYTESMFDHNLKSHLLSGKITKSKGSSHEILKRLQQECQKFDYVYVDGAHHADDVYEDAQDAWNLIDSGAVIIFDDYEDVIYEDPASNPKAAIDRFVAENENALDVLSKPGCRQFCIRKK